MGRQQRSGSGRYIQADPLGLVDGSSVYGYALQSPNRYVDPRGEAAAAVCAIPGLCPAVVTGVVEVCKAAGAAVIRWAARRAAMIGAALVVSSEACSCGDETCPTKKEAQAIASGVGNALVSQYKLTGMGAAAGRSGGHGTPHKRAGAQMNRDAGKQKCATMKAAYLWKAKQLRNKGKGISH